MQILLNAVPLLSPLTGIGQYTYQLAKGLQALENIDLNLFYATGWSRELRDKPVQNIVKYKALIRKLVPFSYFSSRFLQQYNFNKGINKQVDLYHEPNFLSFKFRGPTVVTVHDLSWIRFPEAHPKERVEMMDRYFESGLRKAELIITDSHFVKQEIMDVFGLASDVIKPIGLGVEPLFVPKTAQETQSLLSQHDLKHGQYIVSVGTLEPRKNIEATLRAYMNLSPAVRKQCPLILIGMKGWHVSELEKQIEPLVRAGEIRVMGYLSREELATIVSGALTLVYPSIYEGFGLPPLEAMSCGVPVIASNVSSLPEVVGDAGFLIDPHDIDGLTRSMETMISAPDIRHDLSGKALKHSQLFSWQRCVEQTVEAYQQVLT